MYTLQIKNLYLSTPKKAILNNVSLNVKSRSITGLIGKSGSGKTSLLKSILHYSPVYRKFKGQILLNGIDILQVPARKIQPVFQDPSVHFNPSWNLQECLFEPLEINFSLTIEEKINKITRLLEELNFKDFSILKKNIMQFSGGELQRFAIIRALLTEPDLLLMDEPVSALDVIVIKSFLELIKKMVSMRKVSLLFIAHDLDIVKDICDYIYIIDGGKIVEEGEANKIFLKPSAEVTKTLIDSRNLDDIRKN